MAIHKCEQYSGQRAAVCRRRHKRPALVTASVGRLARKPIRHPRFVAGRRFGEKRHCPKLTVFFRSANRSATLGSPFIELPGGGSVAGAASVKYCLGWVPRGPGLTRRTLVRTLVQSPESRRYGCDPGNMHRSPRRLPARHRAWRGFVRAIVFNRHMRRTGTRCQTQARRESWQRASGPSSRITGAEPACTASGCGCAPGQGGRSCQTGVARAAAR